MPGLDIVAPPISPLRANVGQLVYVKRAWLGAWTLIPFVTAASINLSAAPKVSTARFKYSYGPIMRSEVGGELLNWYPYTLRGAYIRVDAIDRWGTATLFVGQVEDEAFDVDGNTNIVSGNQEWRTFGLEQILDRNEMTGAYTDKGFVDTAMIFNKIEGNGLSISGNKSADNLFSAEKTVWTNLDIINYILKHYVNALPGPSYVLTGATTILNKIVEEHNFDGMTPWQALQELIPRQRALGFYLDYFANGTGDIFLDVFSTLSAPISADGTLLEANNRQILLNFLGARDVALRLRFTNLDTYSSVLVLGGGIFSCFSISSADGTWVSDWSAGDEAIYKAGSTVEGAEATDHDVFRNRQALRDVFQKFKLVNDWDGFAGNGEGGYGPHVPSEGGFGVARLGQERSVTPRDGTKNALVGTDVNGVANAALWANFWQHGKVFEQELPITVPNSDPNNPEYREMFVVVNVPKEDGSDQFVYINKLDSVGLQSSNVRPADKGLAIYVEPNINHVNALHSFITEANLDAQVLFNNFGFLDTNGDGRLSLAEARVGIPGLTQLELDAMNPSGEGEGPSGDDLFNAGTVDSDTNTDPEINFYKMIATVNLRTDWRLLVQRTIPGGRVSETPRTKIIERRDAELWHVTEGTVLDIQDDAGDGVLLERQGATGNIVRDDSPSLRSIADLAIAWYGRARAIVNYELKHISVRAGIGAMVRGVIGPEGFTEVGTVVTSVGFIFSDNDVQRTIVDTNFSELDAEAVTSG